MITKIDEAIEAILDGGAVSSYQIRGRSLARYSLSELRELRAEYSKIASSSQGGARNYVRFDDPR